MWKMLGNSKLEKITAIFLFLHTANTSYVQIELHGHEEHTQFEMQFLNQPKEFSTNKNWHRKQISIQLLITSR